MAAELTKELRPKPASVWRTIGKILFRTFLVLFTTVLLLVDGIIGLVYTYKRKSRAV